MSMLAADYEAAVDAIYRAATSPEVWPDTLTLLADHIGAIGGLLAYANPTDPSSNFLVTGRLRDDLTELYLERYALNPYSRALMRTTPGRVHITNRLVDIAAVRRTAYHADILAPQAIEDHVLFTHSSLTRNGTSGGISFPLGRRHADESAQAAARLGRLAPHLSRAIDLNLQLGQHASGLWQLEHILDAMPGAALLLERRGGIIRTNAAADILLRQADGICAINAEGLFLAAQLPSEARALSNRIAQALAVARGEDQSLEGSLQITRPSGRPPLIVLITPLRPPSFSLWDAVDGGARAMVQIVDAHAPTSMQAETLRIAAGLTAAEARVAALIGSGMSSSQAAATLGVSMNTVKTHLTRCFDKTGVRSQAALARLLASIPVSTLPISKPTSDSSGE
jgi:DNA-binding CsgD family transcriptional regulator